MKFGKIKAIFGLGVTPIYGLKNGQIKSLPLIFNLLMQSSITLVARVIHRPT